MIKNKKIIKEYRLLGTDKPLHKSTEYAKKGIHKL